MKRIDGNIKTELRIHILRKYGKQKRAAAAWNLSEAVLSRVLSPSNEDAPPRSVLDDAGIFYYRNNYYYWEDEAKL